MPPVLSKLPDEPTKVLVVTGLVTNVMPGRFGMVSEKIFYMESCVSGAIPAVGDKVVVEVEQVSSFPFEFYARKVAKLDAELEDNVNVWEVAAVPPGRYVPLGTVQTASPAMISTSQPAILPSWTPPLPSNDSFQSEKWIPIPPAQTVSPDLALPPPPPLPAEIRSLNLVLTPPPPLAAPTTADLNPPHPEACIAPQPPACVRTFLAVPEQAKTILKIKREAPPPPIITEPKRKRSTSKEPRPASSSSTSQRRPPKLAKKSNQNSKEREKDLQKSSKDKQSLPLYRPAVAGAHEKPSKKRGSRTKVVSDLPGPSRSRERKAKISLPRRINENPKHLPRIKVPPYNAQLERLEDEIHRQRSKEEEARLKAAKDEAGLEKFCILKDRVERKRLEIKLARTRLAEIAFRESRNHKELRKLLKAHGPCGPRIRREMELRRLRVSQETRDSDAVRAQVLEYEKNLRDAAKQKLLEIKRSESEARLTENSQDSTVNQLIKIKTENP